MGLTPLRSSIFDETRFEHTTFWPWIEWCVVKYVEQTGALFHANLIYFCNPGGADHNVRLVSSDLTLNPHEAVRVLRGHRDYVNSLAFHPGDGSQVLKNLAKCQCQCVLQFLWTSNCCSLLLFIAEYFFLTSILLGKEIVRLWPYNGWGVGISLCFIYGWSLPPASLKNLFNNFHSVNNKLMWLIFT